MAFQGKNKGVLVFSGTGLEHAIAEWENSCGIHKNEEIKKLITKMKYIIAVLKEAEKKKIISEVDRLCLGELKEVAFDAEDLIDELATNASVQSTGAHTYDIATITSSLMGLIHEMNNRLDRLQPQIDMHGFQIPNIQDSCPVLPTWRQTGALLPDKSSVIGRDGEKEQIIKILLSDLVAESSSNNNKGFSIVPIVGWGGMGKTTLAQLVYNDEKVQKHFELMMWVCVSTNSDRQRLTKEMIEATYAYRRKHENCNITNWDTLQQILLNKVEGKTFLLVLDDVCDTSYYMWEELFKPLHSGKKGSKVLVTSRNRAFVDKMEGRMETHILLGGLSDANIWDVFKSYAFRGNMRHDGTISTGYSHLENLEGSIVQKLKGSPLAAKTLGSLLNRELSEQHWKTVLKNTRMETMGSKYFDELLCMSFFEPAPGQYSWNDEYVMHDLIHDLAEYVSRDDCFRLEDQKLGETPDTTVRHLSVWFSRRDQKEITINELCCYEKLRTLLSMTWYDFDLKTSDLDQLFLKLKMLRVLVLRYCGIRELPDSIGDLKHLRYLDLGWNVHLTQLPESLGNLYNLQVLNLYGCRSTPVLPSTMSQLVNLKHLQPYGIGLLSTIDGVGKLTGLQELQVRGRQLRELGGMCMLRQLKITDLKEVGSKKEAIQARLHTMERLQVLQLEWSGRWSSSMNQDSIKPELEEEVLQALRPNKCIRELHIQGYGGIKSPDWMEVPTLLSSFSSLRRVSLSNCPNWQVPPCSFLRQLEYLQIDGMREWEEWICPLSWDCLLELTISDCPKLKELPLLPRALRSGSVLYRGISCLHSELDGCSRVDGGIATTSSPHSSPPTSASLSRLYISSCDNLTSIGGLLQQQLPDLVEINIYNCKNLVESLPEKGFGHLVSLKRLKIANCPELTCLLQEEEKDASTQHLPCSLEELEIYDCGDAMGGWWWAGVHRLTSITQLSLRGCPTTIELLFDKLKRNPHPHLPATLRQLLIDHGQQSATSSACSSQLSPSPILPPIPHNNVDASAGILRAFTSLKGLTIRHCPNFLQKWGGCGPPSSLERLTVAGDDDLRHEDLSAWLHNLISLKQLTLQNLSSINTLEVMSLPTSLKSLDLQDLKNLHSLPDLNDEQSINVEDPLKRMMHGRVPMDDHIRSTVWADFGDLFSLSSWDFAALVPDIIGVLHHFSSHSMHVVLSTLLLAAIYLSRNYAIYEAFVVLGSSSASGATPFPYYHSMGKGSAIVAET
ncbi:hypothetical protein Taro_050001 [Colocasia esculenta]|uniref:Uncharacterized protein n=1 Tax=Colocasia esculenta TaxID=4460 RepID=A0A843XCA1_COLES|nr:hypothetical protein [Colocasia esculenta]